MIAVSDSSPLIFLGKVRRLDLLRATVDGDILVPASVRAEVLPATVDPAEAEYLEGFLRTCRIVSTRHSRRFASAMSQTDNDALTLALRCKADLFLCDDRITRLAAETEGIRPLGTLGILLRACRKGSLPGADAKDVLDRLVRCHGFRIGIELYRMAIAAIGD